MAEHGPTGQGSRRHGVLLLYSVVLQEECPLHGESLEISWRIPCPAKAASAPAQSTRLAYSRSILSPSISVVFSPRAAMI